MIGTIIITVVSSTAISQLIQFLINRHDAKKNVGHRLAILEKDGIRTQLLLLLLFSPEEKKEILTIAQHYFEKLDGNWYMTTMFNGWLEKTGIAKPEWFNEKKEQQRGGEQHGY